MFLVKIIFTFIALKLEGMICLKSVKADIDGEDTDQVVENVFSRVKGPGLGNIEREEIKLGKGGGGNFFFSV